MSEVNTIQEIIDDPRVDLLFRDDSDEEKPCWCYLRSGLRWDNRHQHAMHTSTIEEICTLLNNGVLEWPEDPDLEQNIQQTN